MAEPLIHGSREYMNWMRSRRGGVGGEKPEIIDAATRKKKPLMHEVRIYYALDGKIVAPSDPEARVISYRVPRQATLTRSFSVAREMAKIYVLIALHPWWQDHGLRNIAALSKIHDLLRTVETDHGKRARKTAPASFPSGVSPVAQLAGRIAQRGYDEPPEGAADPVPD